MECESVDQPGNRGLWIARTMSAFRLVSHRPELMSYGKRRLFS